MAYLQSNVFNIFRHFDDIFECISSNANDWNFNRMALQRDPTGTQGNKAALVSGSG